MVDESDLLALLDDDTAAALTTCNCKEKCAAGQVNTGCPVCKNNMSECTGAVPVTPEPDKDAETEVPAPKPEKKSNVGMVLIVFILVGAAGAAYYYIKFVKGRKPKDEDLDFFDDEATRKSRTSTRMKSRRLRRMLKRTVMRIDLSHCRKAQRCPVHCKGAGRNVPQGRLYGRRQLHRFVVLRTSGGAGRRQLLR